MFNLKTPNMFAGSILDLEEDTAYDVRLTLSDPDGGAAVRTATVKTRAEPKPASGGKSIMSIRATGKARRSRDRSTT